MRLQKLIVLFIALSMSVFMLTSCQSDDDSGGSSSSSGFQVSPSSSSLAMGASTQLSATSDGSDVSSSATWSSSDSSIVTVSNTSSSSNYPKGTITAKRTGTATITATYNGSTANASITVTSATLSSIQVSPIRPSLAQVTTPTLQFTATGIYSDGTKLDLTEYVTWSSNDTAAATISNTTGSSGLATTVAPGSTTISAAFEGTSSTTTGSTLLTLTSAALSSWEATPMEASVSIADNSVVQFTATALLNDGTTQDVTKDTVWSSTDTTNAPISNSEDSKGKATAIGAAANVNIDGTFNGGGATDVAYLDAVNSTLDSVQIFPANPTIALGVDFQLSAKGIFDIASANYTTQDLTSAAVWTSSDATVATICNSSACKGKVSTVATGSATITAAMPSGATASITLTVSANGNTLTEIQVTPTNPSVFLDTKQQFIATGIYSDGTNYFHEDLTEKVIWSSSDETVAIVSNAAGEEGEVKNVAAGTATITATIGLVSGTSDLTTVAVATLTDIEVTPIDPYIAEGMTQQFRAIGIFSDGTTKDVTNEAIWTSADSPNTGRISNAVGTKGLAVGVSVAATDDTLITASLDGNTGTSKLWVFDIDTVTDYPFTALEMIPETDEYTIAEGASIQLQAIGIFDNAGDAKKTDLTQQATWVSDTPAVATVDNHIGTAGLVRGVSTGTANITAYWTDLGGTEQSDLKVVTVSASTIALDSIQITPSDQALDLGMMQQFKAKGIYTDGSSYAVYELPPDLAWMSVDSSSSSTINAPIGSDWKNHGLSKMLTAGTNTISAKYDSKSASETLTTADVTLQSITVSPSDSEIVTGSKVQYRAYGSYSDGANRDITELVLWSSSGTTTLVDNGDNKGLVYTSAAELNVTITAELDSVNGTASVEVKTNTNAAFPIELTPSAPVLGPETTLQLTATGIFTAAGVDYNQDITGLVYWTSSAPAVATVSNAPETNGRVYGVGAGTATITAYWTDGVPQNSSGTVDVTVSSGTLSSIEISPDQPSGPVGFAQQLTATALYSDNNTQDISESVVWTSSDSSIISVSNEEGSRGKITRKAVGSATITARFGSTSATATVSVW